MDKQLFAACETGDAGAVAGLLAAGADPAARRATGCTPLHAAAICSQASIARLLLAAGADVGARNKDGATPLHNAATCGNEGIAMMLLDAGADPTVRDVYGRMPEDVARQNLHMTLCEFLTKARHIKQSEPIPKETAQRGGRSPEPVDTGIDWDALIG